MKVIQFDACNSKKKVTKSTIIFNYITFSGNMCSIW